MSDVLSSIVSAKRPRDEAQEGKSQPIRRTESSGARGITAVDTTRDRDVIGESVEIAVHHSVEPMVFSASMGSHHQQLQQSVPAVISATPLKIQQLTTSLVIPQGIEEEIGTFLSHVVKGKQYEAETMLIINPALALVSGDVTDHAGRYFRDITGFQLAVHQLDWHMWEMLLEHMPADVAAAQAQDFASGAWVGQHGSHATWQRLIDELPGVSMNNVGINPNNGWHVSQKIRTIGDLLYLAPVHVLQEYCHPTRIFTPPCPNFTDKVLPRVDVHGYFPDRGEWMFNRVDELRYRPDRNGMKPQGWTWSGLQFVSSGDIDGAVLAKLLNTRIGQRSELVASLTAAPTVVARPRPVM